MMRRVAIIAIAMVLAGCATAAGKAPTCDGKHRRPGNPHGSVLDTAPAPAAPPGATAPTAPSCGA